MKLIKFGAEWCGPCQHLKKVKTLEKFVEKHSDVSLELVDLPDDDQLEALDEFMKKHGEEAELPEDLKAVAAINARADEADIEHVPTIIFEDDHGRELVRGDGAITAGELEKLYAKALKKAAA